MNRRDTLFAAAAALDVGDFNGLVNAAGTTNDGRGEERIPPPSVVAQEEPPRRARRAAMDNMVGDGGVKVSTDLRLRVVIFA